MSTSYSSKLTDYIHRQYEVEEGDPAENIYALFEEDLKYFMGNGKMGSREMLAKAATTLRSVPKSERIVEVSNIVENGNRLNFHLRIRYRNPKSGEIEESHTDSEWVFGKNGKVAEVRPKQTEETARVLDDLT